MRPLIGIVLLVLAAVGLAMYASKMHPGGDLPPAEIQAEKDAQDAKDARDKADHQKGLIDHSPSAFENAKAGVVQATLVFKGKAPMKIEFYPVAAPKTVAQITGLIKKHFYDGIKVHRVENGSKTPDGRPGLKLFQFGDPVSAKTALADFDAQKIGSHGSGTTVPLELKLPHAKYSIGMARSQGEDTGESQIYINTDANPSLDGSYCVFGMVTGGQEVLDTIQKGDVISSFTIP